MTELAHSHRYNTIIAAAQVQKLLITAHRNFKKKERKKKKKRRDLKNELDFWPSQEKKMRRSCFGSQVLLGKCCLPLPVFSRGNSTSGWQSPFLGSNLLCLASHGAVAIS